MKVWVVIAAYNEARFISEVVADLKPRVDGVIVVDDCSKDETARLASEAGALVLAHVINRGQGAALRTGTEEAIEQGADIIVHFDGDGQFIAEEIARVVEPICRGEADVVLGSRFLDESSKLPWSKKYVLHPAARLLNRSVWGINFSDPQCGFRAFSLEAARSLRWRQDRMAHASEILALLSTSKWRVKEVPVTVIYHDYGQGLLGGFKIIKELFIKYLSR